MSNGRDPVVAIGYCHYGTVAADWMESLINFIVYDFGQALRAGRSGRWAHRIYKKGSYIASSRNNIAQMMMEETEADWLWSLDIDMTWDPDTLERLLALADPVERPVVGALYLGPVSDGLEYSGPSALAPDPPIAPLWTWERGDLAYAQVREIPPGDLVPLTSCGMGCTLIHRSALERVGAAHEGDEWRWFGHDEIEFGDKRKRAGEDVTFCHRLNQLQPGLVWGAPQVRCNHIKDRLLTVADLTPEGPRIVAT